MTLSNNYFKFVPSDFLLTIPPEPTKVGQFEEHMMRKKYVEIVKDPDLVNAFYAIYKKDNKLEVGEMVRDYFHYFPRQLQHEDSSTKRSSKDVGSKVSMSSKGSKKSKSKSSLKGSKSSKTSVKKSKVSVVEPAEGGLYNVSVEMQRIDIFFVTWDKTSNKITLHRVIVQKKNLKAQMYDWYLN